jgi:two-component system, LytTR family, sensor kinase
MKDFFKPANIHKIEFWAATSIFIFAVFFLTTSTTSISQLHFQRSGIPFNYYANYFLPQLFRYAFLYAAFLLINFWVAPSLIKKERVGLNILLVVVTFATIGLVLGIADTWSKTYLFHNRTEQQTYDFIFQKSFLFAFWLLFMFAFYVALKEAALYLLFNSEIIPARFRTMVRDAIIAFALWMVSLFILVIGEAEVELIMGWSIVIPFGILFYFFVTSFILPRVFKKRAPLRAYAWRSVLVLFLSFFPVFLVGMVVSDDEDFALGLAFFNVAVQLIITVPLAWLLYKRQIRGSEEVYVLKKELGQSNANLDFLRSQINPHFLFNALNTIYGTAIQEKAERTSEGVERLGDMMRFMLQENHQEKISLVREVEYLNNYISLQKLRTDPIPTIKIETAIDEEVNLIRIAPMLLIPFVENAFKHGISFREPSYIKIALEVKEKTINFDVYNSKHAKLENDPEKNNTGIGLNNVRQRLQLLYPGRHELIIRETGKEFFVHLTLQT